MIRLLGIGIPTVIVAPAQAAQLQEGQELGVDGEAGVIAAPEALPAPATEWLEDQDTRPRLGAPIRTADGQEVALRASIGDRTGAAAALANGAEAVGLVRSEYLTARLSEPPDATFFKSALRNLCEAARPLTLTIRTLDIAADKRPPWLPPAPGMQGPIGLQGSRLYDREPLHSVFLAQLDALAILAQDFPLRLLLPYISKPEEFRRWRDVVRDHLPGSVPLGTMAETPAAVLEMSEWAGLADFVAVGCNDLMQCLFAADRDVSEVAPLLDPYAPALYRLLRCLVAGADDRTPEIQLCGLLPQVTGVLPALLGLGFRAFSVEPVLVPRLARDIVAVDVTEAEGLAEVVCAQHDSASVRSLLGVSASQAWAFGAA